MDLYCVQGKSLSYALYVLIIRAILFLTSWGGLLETSITFGVVYALLAEQLSMCENNHPFGPKKYQTNRVSDRGWYNAERCFKDRQSYIEVFYERQLKRATVSAIRRFIYLKWCSVYFCVEKTKQRKWIKAILVKLWIITSVRNCVEY